ncbi:DUF4407 domain-containing protein [Psychroserpens sp.]|uniref:DUF4407 domain-containing protein n=1 Tax=Psychroserpens sp. TaxID=2020870 RepID=UPI001B100893|nr:DUF4407 domain-containing protein [Psychroserpens sp.]MBO6605724.1 DUF4407 domain-containing protein [Psychroserpens sp.]MBO6630304.1 DUF4407 domain-containing protein [Psychroserpens sp.]MBO6652905.1 DUF4407 domain-containing protein [Psychroserpens sp.]MBO6681323.1 DUF4407 domain-containing protein [Psychroserpens sp.]MBO6749098.1 DUF4407 domain-containing protein [Psychroserpens sp.]
MLKKFFIICSGADTDILDTCSIGEQNKYAGVGATVFFTAVMAFIASSYALYTVFDNLYTAIGFGFVWGLLIFNLDRFIVSTIKKRNNIIDEVVQATPRIILAVIIAVVISKPLELKIFQKEIDQVLLEQKNELTLANQVQIAEQYTPNIDALEANITTLQNQVATKEAEVNALYDIYITEAEGTAGTGLLGKGPVYEEKREKHDAALAELQQLKADNKAKIDATEAQIAQLQSDYESQVDTSQPIIDGFDGLMARVNALNELPFLPSLFIFLLFLAIETSPIIAKLLSPKGEYDFKLEDAETAIKTWVEQKVSEREILLKTDLALNNKIYNDIAEEDELYNYKRQKARELMQLQADAFFKNQKSAL